MVEAQEFTQEERDDAESLLLGTLPPSQGLSRNKRDELITEICLRLQMHLTRAEQEIARLKGLKKHEDGWRDAVLCCSSEAGGWSGPENVPPNGAIVTAVCNSIRKSILALLPKAVPDGQ